MSAAERPLVSVLIATHNRQAKLERCLAGLAEQDLDPADFEVVIGDDGSDDGSPAAIEAGTYPFALRLLRLPKGGKAAAINAALELARAEVVLCLDDDMIAGPHLVAGHLEAHRRDPMALGIGAIYQQPIAARDWFATTFAAGWNRMYEERKSRDAAWNDCYGANFSAPRDTLREVGGIRPIPTAEDLDIGYRLTQAGCHPVYLPEADGVHDDQKPGSRMIAGNYVEGRIHAMLAAENPSLAPTLVPWERHSLSGEVPLRRALIATHFPPTLLARLGPAVPRRYQGPWWGLTKDVAFWTGIKESVSRAEWRALTGGRRDEAEAASAEGVARSPEVVNADPGARPRYPDGFDEPTSREVALRRALLWAGVPTGALSPLGRVLPGGAGRTWREFTERYAFWRGVRDGADPEAWQRVTRRVPVLMYHAFTAAEGESDRFLIGARDFARQMRLLALLRYRVIGLAELAAALREDRPLPRRAVVITIDDGYRDNLEVALPILRRHGFPASVFMVSGKIGTGNDWDPEGAAQRRPLLTLAEIGRMRDAGVVFGAHTRTHCHLPELGEEEIRAEVAGSRGDLEAALGEPVDEFTYPYGQYDDRSLAAVREAGYLAACTTWARRARAGDDPLEIPRIEVDGTDSPAAFLKKLTGLWP